MTKYITTNAFIVLRKEMSPSSFVSVGVVGAFTSPELAQAAVAEEEALPRGANPIRLDIVVAQLNKHNLTGAKK